VPAPDDALRARGGRLVERGRRRRPPVEQELGALVVRQPDPADVAALARDEVEAAERQALLDGGQLTQPLGVQGVEGVPLGPAARGRDDGRAADLLQGAGGPLAQAVEVPVEPVDVGLLAPDLTIEVTVQVGGAQRSSPGPSAKVRPRPGCGCGRPSAAFKYGRRGARARRRGGSEPSRSSAVYPQGGGRDPFGRLPVIFGGCQA